MSIIVHSPYDGRPVKVRDQDLQRAVRDAEGRIFYAVERSDGQGYYGSPTRVWSLKEEQRYLQMLEKTQRAREVGAELSAQQIHDATGQRSGTPVIRWLFLLLVLIAMAAGAWFWMKPDNPTGESGRPPTGEQTPDNTDPGGGSADGDVDRSTRKHGDVINGETHPDRATVQQLTRGYIGTSSGLRYTILRAGTGETAVASRYVQIHYTASTLGGRLIDASAPDHPVGFVLWSGQAPRGWDEGIAGMRVGEKRRMVLTPDLLYGRYPGKKPLPETTLQFDIELAGVLPGVRYTTDTPGTGTIARPGDTVRVHYRAYIGKDQSAYDSTYGRGDPIEFRIGAGQVIPGWELGVIGMSEGERRTITIPPYLGYGERGAAGVIPPGATLRYTVELVQVTGPASRHADVGLNLAG